jgi:cytochrome P450
MTDQLQVSPFDPEVATDPYPLYARLRQTGPAHQIVLPSGVRAWLITRYEDGRRALADPRLAKRVQRPLRTVDGHELPSTGEEMDQHMLNLDPPDHTRLRKLVQAAFTARRVEALRPRIQQITDELLDAVAGQPEAELIDALAFPLPIQVICELVGVPMDDRASFRAWSNTLIAGSQAEGDFADAVVKMSGYLRELLARKRVEPAGDLLSALIAGRDTDDRLTEDELVSMTFLLLVAGHETTVNLIGNGVRALLTHPDQLARLRGDERLLPTAVEEFLRYEGPVETSTFRFATESLEIGGALIEAGDVVLISLLSANRDTAKFADADDLDLGRVDNQHLAFGHGIHYCLGAPLARLEAQIAIGTLLRRFDRIELADPSAEPAWRPGVLLRGLGELRVTLG